MSISLDTLGLYSNNLATTSSTSKTKELESTLNNVNQSSDEELMEACKSFEAYFLEQVFKSMEKTVMKDESSTESSGYSSYFKDMLTQEYAKNATETGGYGIAQMLFESMKRS